MVSEVPLRDLANYIEEILQVMETSGKKAPKWFEELRRIANL
jgi:hypothetical protein